VITRHFDEEMELLKQKILRMGAMVEDQISSSIKAMIERNSELAKKVIENDHLVNALDVEIDEDALVCFAAST